jgi:hypothetical protein
MKIRLSTLRQIIREEVQRNMRWLAGFGGGMGASGRSHDGSELRPEHLGDESQAEEENLDYGKEQEEKQFTVRVDDRRPRSSRSP